MHGMSFPNRAEEHEHDRSLHGIMLHADITTKSGNAASEPVINVLTLNVAEIRSGTSLQRCIACPRCCPPCLRPARSRPGPGQAHKRVAGAAALSLQPCIGHRPRCLSDYRSPIAPRYVAGSESYLKSCCHGQLLERSMGTCPSYWPCSDHRMTSPTTGSKVHLRQDKEATQL